mmetsp:Transcript_17562/g.34848  ORF Transcript_17562/g.34848 Transcript_17562/m.34848 type:complete len:547 (-) Transcript_17562:92-1732(-)
MSILQGAPTPSPTPDTEKKHKIMKEDGRFASAIPKTAPQENSQTSPTPSPFSLHEMIIAMQKQIDSMSQRLSLLSTLQEKCHNLELKCQQLEEALVKTNEEFYEEHQKLYDKTRDTFLRHQCLIHCSKWEFSAPEIDSSYWEARGMSHDEILGAESLLENFPQMAQEMRRGVGEDVEIFLHFDDGSPAFGEMFPHDDTLIPHWEEFADALEKYKVPPRWFEDGYSSLKIINVEMPEEVINLLDAATGWRNLGFETLHFGNNNFGRRGLEWALKLLQGNNSALDEFILSRNSITDEDMDFVEQLCDAVKNHGSLTLLAIGECMTPESSNEENRLNVMRTILERCSGRLKTFDFTGNHVATHGDPFLYDFLRSNPELESLRLRDNYLNDDDAVHVANALRHNTNLQYLALSGNNFTERGIAALETALFDQTSLNSAADSNHRCIIHLGDYDIENDVNGNYIGDATENRKRKIYKILSRQCRDGSNLMHLDEENIVPEIMPNVLGMIASLESLREYQEVQLDGELVEPIALVYEIMRGWKMPMLYCFRK